MSDVVRDFGRLAEIAPDGGTMAEWPERKRRADKGRTTPDGVAVNGPDGMLAQDLRNRSSDMTKRKVPIDEAAFRKADGESALAHARRVLYGDGAKSAPTAEQMAAAQSVVQRVYSGRDVPSAEEQKAAAARHLRRLNGLPIIPEKAAPAAPDEIDAADASELALRRYKLARGIPIAAPRADAPDLDGPAPSDEALRRFRTANRIAQ
jgi:hypothetical protein